MNSVLDFIFSRRSVRKFKKEEIGEDKIKSVLEAGMAAPSACTKDPWRFVIVREKETLEKIAEGLPNGKFLPEASVGIVVCGDIALAHGNELSYMIQDCSAAIENMLLAINALGLGACWLGVHPREDRIEHIKEILDLPESVIPLSVLAVGVPESVPEARTRYNASYVYNEKWQD